MNEMDHKADPKEKEFAESDKNNDERPADYPKAPLFDRSGFGQYGNTDRNKTDNAQVDKNYSRKIEDHGAIRPERPDFDSEYYSQKRSLFVLGNAIGLPLCMFFFISYALNFLVGFGLSAIAGVYTANRFLSDPNVSNVLGSCVSLIAFTVPYLYTLKVTDSTFAELVPVKKVSPSKCSALVMLGFGAFTLSTLVTEILALYSVRLFGVSFESVDTDYNADSLSLSLMLLCVGVLPAILEEFAFRGVILSTLRKKFSDSSAIIISAAMFGMLHGNLMQTPFAFCMGIMLGYAAVYSGSIIPSVIIHMLTNCISVLMNFAMVNTSPMERQVGTLLYYAVALVIGICGFIMLTKSDKNALKLSNERSENTLRFSGWFLRSTWILVFITLCVLQILAVQGVFK